jgi:hypothetical protein
MNCVLHRNYIGGPLDGKVVAAIDWPDEREWLLHDGTHLYGRRSRRAADNEDAISAIYYLGEATVPKPGPQLRVLPYYLRRFEIHDPEGFEKLFSSARTHLSGHNHAFVVLLKLISDFPQFIVTQALHATSSDQALREFIDFARTLQFDAEHDV